MKKQFVYIFSLIAVVFAAASLTFSILSVACAKANQEEPSTDIFIEVKDEEYVEPKPDLEPELVEPVEEAESDIFEEEYYEEETYEYDYVYYEEPSYTYEESYSSDFKSMGVIYDDNGTKYTWYSQNVLPGGGLDALNNNGRHVDDEGYIRDGDGYISVASSDHPIGTVIDTPFGEAKVYDTGCDSGTIDIYTDF